MGEVIQKAKDKARQTHREVLLQTMTLINGAFALIAALAWNEAVKALIERYFKAGSGLYSRFVYAIGITILVVIITRYISSLSKRFDPDSETNQKE